MRGALCMANAGANTNGSQFFIVQKTDYTIADVMNLRSLGLDEDLVDYYKENGGACWLYKAHTVFGQVIEGYDVLDEVAGVKVNSQGKPDKDVIIDSIDFDIY
jgi:peptidyl-prolyl cis-trans isomerase B (cyclophilin B)